MSAIGFIGAPTSAGAYAPGQELAPKAIRDAGFIGALRDRGIAVNDRGDTPVQRWSPDQVVPLAQNVSCVCRAIDAVKKAVSAALVDGEFVLIVGGDCTVGVGSLRALDSMAGKCGLLYLDLHADMNTPASTTDGALDWMGLGHMLSLEGCVEALALQPPLEPSRVSLLGFDPTQATEWERRRVDELAIACTTVTALARDPIGAARSAIDRLGAGFDRLAVHFDVDLVDFVDAPLSENTGRNMGVPLATALTALEALLSDRRVAVLTVTELNPLHGAEDGSTMAHFAAGLAPVVSNWAMTR